MLASNRGSRCGDKCPIMGSMTRRGLTKASILGIGAGYSFLALLLGPWGVPWGLVRTPWAVWTNLTGGVDVTEEVIRQLGKSYPDPSIPHAE